MPETVPAAKANWRTTLAGILGALPLVAMAFQSFAQMGFNWHAILQLIAGAGIGGIGVAATDGANVKAQAQINKP